MKYLLGFAVVMAIVLSLFKKDPDAYNKNATLPPSVKIVAFGDSLTFGTGADVSYPEQLSRLVGVEIVNAGNPGEVSEAGLTRLPKILRKYQPDIVILCHGGNDILRRMDLEKTAEHLRQMVEVIQASGAQVVLVGVPTFEGLRLKRAAFYDAIAKEYDLVYAPNILATVLKERDLKSDRVHPNAAGYARVAVRLRALLLRHFVGA